MRERAVNKHGMGPWTRSLMISLLGTALALGAPVSSVSAQEAVDARIQALERQMEEMRRTMQSMEAELEALRKAPPPEVVAAGAAAAGGSRRSVRDQSPAGDDHHDRGGDRAGRQLEPAEGQGLALRPGEPGDQLRQ